MKSLLVDSCRLKTNDEFCFANGDNTACCDWWRGYYGYKAAVANGIMIYDKEKKTIKLLS